MLLQVIFNGMVLGSVYALIALCFVIIFKATDVVNFAQGELIMLSAYFIFALREAGLPHFVVILLAILFSSLVSFFLGRVVMRPLIGYSIFPIVTSTFAIGLIITGTVFLVWGPQSRHFGSLFGESIFFDNVGIIATTTISVIVFGLFFKYTKFGTALRATSEDIIAAYVCGIPVKKIFILAWIISGGIMSTITAVLITPRVFLSPRIGYIGILAFPAAVLGGFRSIPGALIGGILMGLFELGANAYLPDAIKSISPWMALYIILIIRPEGLFGSYERVKKV